LEHGLGKLLLIQFDRQLSHNRIFVLYFVLSLLMQTMMCIYDYDVLKADGRKQQIYQQFVAFSKLIV